MQELRRQWFHLCFGIAMLLVGIVLGKAVLTGLLVALLLVGLVIIQLVLSETGFKPVEAFLEKLDRQEDLPGRGALTYVAGMLFAVAFSGSFEFALAVIGILAFGDAFSTLVGMSGKYPLPLCDGKTLEGFMAFTVSAFVISQFFMPTMLAFAYSVALGVVECVDLKTDDNLSIPVFAIALRAVLG